MVLIKMTITLLMLLSITVFSEPAPQKGWSRVYGTPGTRGESILKLRTGGYLLIGHCTAFRSDYETQISNPIVVTATDSLGNETWTKTYGNKDYTDNAFAARETKAGTVLIAGKTMTTSSNSNISLIHITAGGDTIWTKSIGTSFNETAYALCETNDKGFVTAGVTSSVNHPRRNVYLLKINGQGDSLWSKSYFNGEAYAIQQTTDKGLIITGYASHPDSDKVTLFLLKTDRKGKPSWIKHYGTTSYNCGYDVTPLPDKGFLVCGFSEEKPMQNSLLVIRTDSRGNMQWQKTYRNYKACKGYHISKTLDGNFIIAGNSEDNKACLVKLNPQGDVIWSHIWGADNIMSEARSVIMTNNDSYVVCGTGCPDEDCSGGPFMFMTKWHSFR